MEYFHLGTFESVLVCHASWIGQDDILHLGTMVFWSDTHSQNQINEVQRSVDMLKSDTQYLAQQQIKLASQQVESLMRETLLQNPHNVMAKGYAIVRS